MSSLQRPESSERRFPNRAHAPICAVHSRPSMRSTICEPIEGVPSATRACRCRCRPSICRPCCRAGPGAVASPRSTPRSATASYRPPDRWPRRRTRAPRPPGRNYRVIALIIACALLMENLDATVLATALPTMARDFRVRAPAMSIALTSYLLALAIFIPASGTMADRVRLAHRVPGRDRAVHGRVAGQRAGAHARMDRRRALRPGHRRRDDDPGRAARAAALGRQEGHGLGDVVADHARADRARSSGRRSAATSSPISTGAGSSTSTCPSGCSASCWSAASSPTSARSSPHPFDPVGFVLSGVSLGSLLFGCEMTSRAGGEAARGRLAGWSASIVGTFYVRHAPQVAPIRSSTSRCCATTISACR